MTRTREFLQQTIELPMWLWATANTALWVLGIREIVGWLI